MLPHKVTHRRLQEGPALECLISFVFPLFFLGPSYSLWWIGGRIVAVYQAWQKFVPSRSPFHILIPRIRIWKVNAAPHQHHTTSTISSGIMVLSAAVKTAIAKSRLLKVREIQQLQLQKRILRLKLSLSGAVASASHLTDIIDVVSFNTRAAFKWTWLLISIFSKYRFPDRL